MHRQSALLSSIFFAVHALHVEAVTSVVGRAELLAAIFFLLSLQLYTRATRHATKTGKC